MGLDFHGQEYPVLYFRTVSYCFPFRGPIGILSRYAFGACLRLFNACDAKYPCPSFFLSSGCSAPLPVVFFPPPLRPRPQRFSYISVFFTPSRLYFIGTRNFSPFRPIFRFSRLAMRWPFLPVPQKVSPPIFFPPLSLFLVSLFCSTSFRLRSFFPSSGE